MNHEDQLIEHYESLGEFDADAWEDMWEAETLREDELAGFFDQFDLDVSEDRP